VRKAVTAYHHPVPLSRNLGNLISCNRLGLSRPVMGLPYFALYFTDFRNVHCKQQVPGPQEDGSELLYRFILHRRGSCVEL